MELLTNLQFNQNSAKNMVIHKLAASPTKPVEGQIYYDTIDKVIKVWNGREWLVGGAETTPTLTIDNISGLKAQLDNKVNNSRVQTDVPVGAIFTDTVTSVGGKTGEISKAHLVGMGLSDKDTVTTINGKTGVITKQDLVAIGLPDKDTVTTVGGKTGAITKEHLVEMGLSDKDTITTVGGKTGEISKAYLVGMGLSDKDTTYSKFTPTDDGLVPKSVDSSTVKYLRADGTWAIPPDNDTKYTKTSLGLGNVDNTSDKQKPLSEATIAALADKAPKAMVLEEASKAENSAKEHTDKKISELIGGSPAILDTLKEIADALGNDPNFAKTMMDELAKRPELHKAAIGNGKDRTFTVTHKLNTRDITVTLRQTQAPYEVVLADIAIPTTDSVKVTFVDPPTSNQYTLVVVG